MVLDDDEQIRQSLLKLLQSEGYEVVLAAEGTEALDKFERDTIDLLLLDLNLPNKSGWDIFERVTSTAPCFPSSSLPAGPSNRSWRLRRALVL